ncbi:MAG: carboxypeptidase-like regulatory domain-containing protein [Flavisolibacter sp.]
MKRLRSSVAVSLLVGVLIIFGCKKGNEANPGNGNNNPPPAPTPISNPNNPSPVTASVEGIVVNENESPLTAVLVRSGNNTTTTDPNGHFRFNSIQLDKYASMVSVDQPGYYKAYKVFPSRDNGLSFIKIKLITKTLVGTIDASSGGVATLPDNSQVNINAGSLMVKSGNQAYNGSVKIYATTIDPTAADIGERIPGSFLAVNKDNQRVVLQSFGMMNVVLEGQNGEALQIASGKKATLKFAIPSSAASQAPATIKLWSVNETTGVWNEAATTATKSGNFYSGDVDHFSSWNCDIPDTTIILSFTLHKPDGKPLMFNQFKISRNDGGTWASPGFTDTIGFASGSVPVNKVLKLEVFNNCAQTVYQEVIGPFSKDTNLGVRTVILGSSDTVNFYGTVTNCSGQPVTNGYAQIYFEKFSYNAPVTNGSFSLTLIKCPNTTSAIIFAVDNAGAQQSQSKTITVNSNNVTVGNLQACGIAGDQFINYKIDNTNYSYASNHQGDTLESFTLADTTIGIYGENFQTYNAIYIFYDASTTGPTPLTGLVIDGRECVLVSPITVNVTSFANTIGEYAAGNFTGTIIKDSTGTQHTITCTFKTRRAF